MLTYKTVLVDLFHLPSNLEFTSSGSHGSKSFSFSTLAPSAGWFKGLGKICPLAVNSAVDCAEIINQNITLRPRI